MTITGDGKFTSGLRGQAAEHIFYTKLDKTQVETLNQKQKNIASQHTHCYIMEKQHNESLFDSKLLRIKFTHTPKNQIQ